MAPIQEFSRLTLLGEWIEFAKTNMKVKEDLKNLENPGREVDETPGDFGSAGGTQMNVTRKSPRFAEMAEISPMKDLKYIGEKEKNVEEVGERNEGEENDAEDDLEDELEDDETFQPLSIGPVISLTHIEHLNNRLKNLNYTQIAHIILSSLNYIKSCFLYLTTGRLTRKQINLNKTLSDRRINIETLLNIDPIIEIREITGLTNNDHFTLSICIKLLENNFIDLIEESKSLLSGYQKSKSWIRKCNSLLVRFDHEISNFDPDHHHSLGELQMAAEIEDDELDRFGYLYDEAHKEEFFPHKFSSLLTKQIESDCLDMNLTETNRELIKNYLVTAYKLHDFNPTKILHTISPMLGEKSTYIYMTKWANMVKGLQHNSAGYQDANLRRKLVPSTPVRGNRHTDRTGQDMTAEFQRIQLVTAELEAEKEKVKYLENAMQTRLFDEAKANMIILNNEDVLQQQRILEQINQSNKNV